MNEWIKFLTNKGHDQNAFDEMDSVEQAKLYAEYNAEAQKAMNDLIESKADNQAIEALKLEMEGNLEEAIKTMKETAQLEAKIQKANDDNASLKEAMKKQGEAIAKQRETVMVEGNPFSEFETKFKEETEGLGEKSKEEIGFSFKVDEPKTFTVNDIAAGTYGAAAIPSNVSADLAFANSREVGTFAAPRRTPDFLQYITNRSPIDSGMMHAIVQTTESGAAAIVGETEVKPYATLNWDLEKVACVTIAVLWKEPRKWRTNFNYLLPRVRQHMGTLISERVEDFAYTGITGTPFVPQTELIFDQPKKLECIGAAIYSQRQLEFNPSVVLVNPIDYATMVHSRSASDNHYDTFNNGSIRVINGSSIISGGETIALRMSTKVPAGEFFVGDFSQLAFGLGSQVEYSQGFVNDDFERNLITNRLEIDAAMLVPSVVSGAFVKDTYANVLPQIQ